MIFSTRTRWQAARNRLTIAREERRARGLETLDLTESNPTRAGIDYPLDELAAALAEGARAVYDPDPSGLRSAREALARALDCDADDLLLAASTSEAYSFLFKLLANPGDEILTAAPSYPLLDHLAAFDSVALRHFPLDFDGRRWALDLGAVASAATARTRAVVIVHPNNPLGSYATEEEMSALTAFCSERSIALVSDEVFYDYPLAAPRRAGPAAAREGPGLVVSLGGLSKSAGLPQLKLAWMRLGGAPALRREARAALELIADSYLSVATPVQAALPRILALAPAIRARIAERVARNLGQLRAALAPVTSLQLLSPEGGWSAVVRIPRLRSDEDVALALLAERGVLVHPGYFFDFPLEGYLVVSLLPEPRVFDAGVREMAGFLGKTG